MIPILKALGGLGGLAFLLSLLVFRLIEPSEEQKVLLTCLFMGFAIVVLLIVAYATYRRKK